MEDGNIRINSENQILYGKLFEAKLFGRAKFRWESVVLTLERGWN